MRARWPYIIHLLLSFSRLTRWPEAVAREKLLDQCVEVFRILQKATMAGAKQSSMFSMRNQSCGSGAAGQSTIVLTVHDQRRRAIGGQIWRQVGDGQCLEYLRDAFRIE